MDHLESAIAAWEGEAVVARFDAATGAWIFIALHSSVLGRPVGGTRMRSYPTPADGLRDAMRLAEGMTCKWAALDLAIGGAKAVLAVPPEPLAAAERRALLARYGDLVEVLRGAFATGEDLGTSPEDMAVIAERTQWVHGVTADGSVVDPGPFTARGVFRGIEAAVGHVLGRDLRGVRVAVQGIGDVGGPLCRQLHASGATLVVADTDDERAAACCGETGAEAVAADAVYDVDCDVFAPCAVGGVLTAETIPRLRCRVIAGSANNQLGEEADARRLHQRHIVYAPDYVINGGGALAFARYGEGERDLDRLMKLMDTVGERIDDVLSQAAERGESPTVTMRRRIDERLSQARAERRGATCGRPASGRA